MRVLTHESINGRSQLRIGDGRVSGQEVTNRLIVLPKPKHDGGLKELSTFNKSGPDFAGKDWKKRLKLKDRGKLAIVQTITTTA
jgi:hypothetical protein